jgi:tetratricopeptide (TPR) repeat protein
MHQAALDYYSRARVSLEHLIKVNLYRTEARRELVTVALNDGLVHEGRNAFRKALDQYEQVIQLAAELHTVNTFDGDQALAVSLERAARANIALGSTDQAEQQLLKATEIYRNRLKDQPLSNEYLYDFATALISMGELCGRASAEKANLYYSEAIDHFSKLLQWDPSDVRYRRNLAQAYLSAANSYSEQGNTVLARKATAQALDGLVPLVSRRAPATYDVELYAWIALTSPFSELHRATDVFTLLDAQVKRVTTPGPSLLALLARSHAELGEYAKAIDSITSALRHLPRDVDRSEYRNLLRQYKRKLSHTERVVDDVRRF